MSRICMRHELSMLRLSVAGLRKGDRGFRTRDHARVLKDIERCDRCRAKRAPSAVGGVGTTAAESHRGEPDRTVYKAVLDPVDEPVARR